MWQKANATAIFHHSQLSTLLALPTFHSVMDWAMKTLSDSPQISQMIFYNLLKITIKKYRFNSLNEQYARTVSVFVMLLQSRFQISILFECSSLRIGHRCYPCLTSNICFTAVITSPWMWCANQSHWSSRRIRFDRHFLEQNVKEYTAVKFNNAFKSISTLTPYHYSWVNCTCLCTGQNPIHGAIYESNCGYFLTAVEYALCGRCWWLDPQMSDLHIKDHSMCTKQTHNKCT